MSTQAATVRWSVIALMDGDDATCTQPVCAIASPPAARPVIQAVVVSRLCSVPSLPRPDESNAVVLPVPSSRRQYPTRLSRRPVGVQAAPPSRGAHASGGLSWPASGGLLWPASSVFMAQADSETAARATAPAYREGIPISLLDPVKTRATSETGQRCRAASGTRLRHQHPTLVHRRHPYSAAAAAGGFAADAARAAFRITARLI